MTTIMLTIRQVTSLKPGEWRSDRGPRGAGTLVFHASSAGNIHAYFRHTLPTGKRYDLPMGLFDASGERGATLPELRERAGALSRLYQSGVRDLKAYLAAQTLAQAEALAADEALRQHQARQRQRYTLAALLTAYTNHLDAHDKTSTARNVRSLVKVNVLEPHPELAELPAREVTKAQLATIIREVRESGRERTAGALRSYLLAAYNLAMSAEGDTKAPSSLIPFAIEANPVLGIKAIQVRPGERTLSRAELRTFIGKLGASFTDQAIKLLLYAGGQRGDQLLRAKASDFEQSTGVLRLWDAKGRRTQPREHRLPLGKVACELAKALVERARRERPESADQPIFVSGKSVLTLASLGRRVAEIAVAMEGVPFTLRDLRRTCETEMAAIGFSADLRAQLLSHGLGGVQSRHYDRHSYITEKSAALAKWELHLEGKEKEKVVPIGRRKKA